MGIPMLKIRRPVGRLIFNMGIAIPSKTVFLIETAPWPITQLCEGMRSLGRVRAYWYYKEIPKPHGDTEAQRSEMMSTTSAHNGNDMRLTGYRMRIKTLSQSVSHLAEDNLKLDLRDCCIPRTHLHRLSDYPLVPPGNTSLPEPIVTTIVDATWIS